jgi:hypothetical protein
METARRERCRGKGFDPVFWFLLVFMVIALAAVTSYGLVQYKRRNDEAQANVERCRQRVEEIKRRREAEEQERKVRLEKHIEESGEKAEKEAMEWYMERLRSMSEPQ